MNRLSARSLCTRLSRVGIDSTVVLATESGHLIKRRNGIDGIRSRFPQVFPV